jgi:fibronectin type 3 domain-containing protein
MKATAGQTYYYAVQAKDTGGDLSPMSAAVAVTTPVMPAAPTALVATATKSTNVTVTWSESSSGLPITSYKVWRGSSPSNLTNVGTRTTPSYSDTTVTTGNTYYYAVQAVDNGGDFSAQSATVSVTTP